MFHVIEHTFLDVIKLVPFLFLTYLLMEFLEHKTKDKTKKLMKKAGKFGPVIGAAAGILPQCGFSAAAAGLYAGRIISMGTLIAIFLSTSDEMLPILISEAVAPKVIVQILGLKLFIGMVAGIVIDLLVHPKVHEHNHDHHHIHELCEHDHCHCEQGNVWKSACYHTAKITFFLLIVSFVLNMCLHFVGEDTLATLILNRPVIGQLLSGLVGLIPNCASSVVITQLYLEGAMSFGAMMSGLLVGAGVGILVLFKVNKNKKEALKVIGILYVVGVAAGILLELLGINPM